MAMIDVETDFEAIAEDEETIEVLGHIASTVSYSIKQEIVNTIEDFLQSIVDWIEWLFPVLLDYQRDCSLFWQDLQRLAIFALLSAISYVLLAPSNGRRKRRTMQSFPSFHFLMPSSKVSHSRSALELSETVLIHANNNQNNLHHTVHNNSNNRPHPASRHSIIAFASEGGFQQPDATAAVAQNRRPSLSSSTICSGRIVMEDETDEERFRKAYQSIAMSRYRRLVLPPACKLVDKPKVSRPAILAMKDSADNNPKQSEKEKRKERKLAAGASQVANRSTSRDKKGKKQNKKNSSEDSDGGKNNSKGKSGIKKSDSHTDEDRPAERLRSYFWSVCSLAFWWAFFQNYVMLGNTLWNWWETIRRIRQYRRSNSQPQLAIEEEEEDDEEDDNDNNSKASQASSVRSLKQHPMAGSRQNGSTDNLLQQSVSTPVRRRSNEMDASFCSARMEEEKKESPHLGPAHMPSPSKYLTAASRTERFHSIDSDADPTVFGIDIGEADVGEHASMPSLRLPLSSKQQHHSFQHKSALQVKKRDLLANYRSSSANSSKFMTHQTNALAGTSSPRPGTIDNALSDPGPPSVRDENDEMRMESPSEEIKRDSSDYGSYFFETANSHDVINKMDMEAALPDKNGYILGDNFLPSTNCTPLLVFVNSRSGPQQGHLLITQLRRLLNPIQVWDLADGGPEEVLESFCALRNLRIMVCGGDGTVSWIIGALEKMNLKRKWPPISILPLGTGNDLARIHGWGGGYNNESLIGILEQVADSYISLLDRWELTVESRKGKVKEVKSFFNYLGVGADAQTALQVHMLRESKPNFFFSRVVNKAWYGLFGAEDIIKATSLNLPNEITLIADGVKVPLPPDSQGIILLNIDSYAGGTPMWANGAKRGMHGHSSSGNSPTSRNAREDGRRFRPFRRTKSLEDLGLKNRDTLQRIDSAEDLSHALTEDQKFERVTACKMPSSCQDGFLDVVSIRGAFHLGQIRVGLSNAQRLCQCREATIHIKRKVAVQVDGEPWRQNVCTLRVKRKATAASMLHKASDENAVETEMAQLLDWAEERKLIDATVHNELMKEFSRRIEDKTRQRRFRSQDNLMYRAFGINQ